MYFYVRSLENLVREENRSRLENRREKRRIKNVAALGEMEKIGAAGSGERERERRGGKVGRADFQRFK